MKHRSRSILLAEIRSSFGEYNRVNIKHYGRMVDDMTEKIYRIGKYEKHSDGKFHFTEEKTTDSPYWKVIDGVVYYVFGTGKHGVNYKEKLHKMPMSETEATKNNCCCYYKIIE